MRRAATLTLCAVLVSGVHATAALALAPWISGNASLPPRLERSVDLTHAVEVVAVHQVRMTAKAAEATTPAPTRSPATLTGNKGQVIELAAIDLSKYLPLDVVDRAATPQTDWNVDPSLLAAVAAGSEASRGGQLRIVFSVFVDPDGTIRKCVIEEPVNLDPLVIRRLEEDLRSTSMLPANRRGSPIGNVRRIEMFVEL